MSTGFAKNGIREEEGARRTVHGENVFLSHRDLPTNRQAGIPIG
jgi:hypothetical protein